MSVLALDLGSTRIKAARVEAGEGIVLFAERDAPRALAPADARREFDPLEFERTARAVLDELGPLRGERLGLASQRSTFLLWDAASGAPATPAISWQDRSAAAWVRRHPEVAQLAEATAGLLLSAHYVGPKLAARFEADPELARRAAAGDLRLGTLDTWLAWRWSEGRVHAVDETMAARTLLFDPARGAWSRELCAAFGVPEALLPRVLATADRAEDLVLGNGLVLAASVADQSAGALHAVGASERGALVNFGTGTFVLAPAGARRPRRTGYLASLLSSRGAEAATRTRRFALEGTINAGAGLFAAHDDADAARSLPEDAFAIVDENGIGAPHWRAEQGPIWSPSAAALEPRARARVAAEGLCFRARAILEDLEAAERHCVVAGGVLHDEAAARRIATHLGRTIEVCLDPEASLQGAAALAAGLTLEEGRARTRRVDPGDAVERSSARFKAWREWSRRALAR